MLAGGKSTRMGANKALLTPWGRNGPTLLERAYNLLRGSVPACLVSCSQALSYTFLPCLNDAYYLESPLNGILTGLQKARICGFDNILALACDLPLITTTVLEQLLGNHYRAPNETLATFYRSLNTGTVEMLAGVYSCNAIPILTDGVESGEKSLYQILANKNCCYIDYGDDLEFAFVNCNTRYDLDRIASESRQSNCSRMNSP